MKLLRIYFNIFLKNYKYLFFYFKRKFFKNYFYDVSHPPVLKGDLKNIVNQINKETKVYYKSNPNYEEWLNNSVKIKKIVNKKINLKINNINYDETISCLQKEGVTKSKELFIDQNEVDQIKKRLLTFEVYPSHIPISSNNKLTNILDAKKRGNFASYKLDDILSINQISNFVFSKDIINIAFRFFAHVPVISNINLYWSFCNKFASGPQMFHRDLDDYKVLNVFSNFTDTGEHDGSFSYISGSHNRDIIKKKIKYLDDNFFLNSTMGYGLDSMIKEKDLKQIENRFFGIRGSVAFADGYCLHKAVKPKTQDRLILWITFNAFRSCYETRKIPFVKRVNYQKVKYFIEDNFINRYVYRNIVDFEY